MKLSEAIRLGAMVFPMGAGGWMDGTKRCALACASEAVGISGIITEQFHQVPARLGINYDALRERWPILCKTVAVPPFWAGDWGSRRNLVETIIWSTNDRRLKTREEIADWVEMLEKEEEAEKVGAEVAEVSA